jgi:hypothetical protein
LSLSLFLSLSLCLCLGVEVIHVWSFIRRIFLRCRDADDDDDVEVSREVLLTLISSFSLESVSLFSCLVCILSLHWNFLL